MGLYTKDYKSFAGHIVIRVHPGGEDYEIFVLDDTSPDKSIISHIRYHSEEDF